MRRRCTWTSPRQSAATRSREATFFDRPFLATSGWITMTAFTTDGGLTMALHIRRVEVWSGELPDRPGAAAATLEALSRAGANLQYVFARQHPTKPDIGVIFLAPVIGPEQERAARSTGLSPASGIAM